MAAMLPLSRHFFKVLNPGFCDKLSIPVAFCRHLNNEKKLDKALIETCLGSWHVKVGRSEDGVLYFEQGWQEFVKHHGFKVGDFLVFEHKGKMGFNVVAFDSSACEKQCPYPTDLANNKMTTTSNYEAAAKSVKHHHHQHSKGKIPLEEIKSSSSRNRPSFTTMMKASHGIRHKPYLNIPAPFVKSTGIVKKSKLVLRDPCGKLWPVKLGTWESNKKFMLRRIAFTRGWHEFYRSNNLKSGDVCIFELHDQTSKSRSKPLLMDVQIVRF